MYVVCIKYTVYRHTIVVKMCFPFVSYSSMNKYADDDDDDTSRRVRNVGITTAQQIYQTSGWLYLSDICFFYVQCPLNNLLFYLFVATVS